MAQGLRQEKIGTLSHNAGNISLSASRLNIGGQQYITTTSTTMSVGTATANTLYMIYAVISSGSVALVKDTAVNSVGPSGYNSWKLVGAFYSGLTNTWGSFVTIEGAPTSEWASWTPTGSWIANTTYTGKFLRKGDTSEIQVNLQLAGAPTSANLSVNMLAGLTMDISKMVYTSAERQVLGWTAIEDNGSGRIVGPVYFNDPTSFLPEFTASTGSPDVVRPGVLTQASPITFANNDRVTIWLTVPILEWSNTPLKDL